MRPQPKLLTAVALASLSSPSQAWAQSTLLHQWDWNTSSSSLVFRTATGGTLASGVATGYGQSNPSTPLSSVITNGSLLDPGTLIGGTTYNRSVIVNPPLTTAANGTIGIQFSAPTTGMSAGEAVNITFSMSAGYRSSRYWQVLVSTTGAAGSFSAPTGGIGSSISQSITGMDGSGGAISGTATVNVSSGGLIDFRTLNNLSLNSAQITTTNTPANFATGFVDNISFTLPTGQGYENNASLAIALVALWDPNGTATTGANGLISSFAGTDSTDTLNGYNRAPASGGSMRLDLVSISAITSVPEPSTYGLTLGALVLSAGLRRRRKKAAN